MAITTAVVPVAGLATRLRPLSRGVPKGLLPVAGRPVVQHVVDELEACGIERVVLVTGRGRSAFAAHFAGAHGPEMVCVDQPGRSGSATRSCAPRPRSTGRSSSRWAMRCWAAAPRRASWSGSPPRSRRAPAPRWPSRRSRRRTRRATGSWRRRATAIRSRSAGVVEKPAPETAPSRLAVAGRYAATPALLDALRDTSRPTPAARCSSPTPSTRWTASSRVRLAPGEERLDVGTVPGYCAAFVEFALSDAELGPPLRARAATLLDGLR